jgi:putative addiction module component (TIGR02574 family)
MTKEAAELLKKALSLPVSERADLAGSLIESLDDTQDESVEAAWDEEAARRMAEIDSGAVKPISLEEARRRLLSALEWALAPSPFIRPRSRKPSRLRSRVIQSFHGNYHQKSRYSWRNSGVSRNASARPNTVRLLGGGRNARRLSGGIPYRLA